MIATHPRRIVAVLALVGTAFLFAACSSPMDLDVDRNVQNIDNKVSPHRLSLYYHFGNQGFEAIVTNEELLKSIIIDKSTYPCKVTIPQFLFTLSDTMKAYRPYSPFVHSFAFSCLEQPADGFFRNAVNKESWMIGDYIDIDGTHRAFNYPANHAGREIRIAFYTVPDENLVKGFAQFIIINPAPADPLVPEFVAYSALITMEYKPNSKPEFW